MITRLDRDVGRILEKLSALGIDRRTVVLFTSDNGPHDEGGHDTERFTPGGPLRGMKRDLYEGGIRVPLIVRWPGTAMAGAITDHVGYFGDLMATAADWAGVDVPPDLDSISLAPTIAGQFDRQQDHEYLTGSPTSAAASRRCATRTGRPSGVRCSRARPSSTISMRIWARRMIWPPSAPTWWPGWRR